MIHRQCYISKTQCLYSYAYFVKTLNNNLNQKNKEGIIRNRLVTLPPPLVPTNFDTPRYLTNISKGVPNLSQQILVKLKLF